eukprot:6174287-Pleurochrysis_carterae.AAC.2
MFASPSTGANSFSYLCVCGWGSPCASTFRPLCLPACVLPASFVRADVTACMLAREGAPRNVLVRACTLFLLSACSSVLLRSGTLAPLFPILSLPSLCSSIPALRSSSFGASGSV